MKMKLTKQTALLFAFIFILVCTVVFFAVQYANKPKKEMAQATPIPMQQASPPPKELTVAGAALGDIVITPNSSSLVGVDVNSDFLIQTTTTLSKDQLISRLSSKSNETFSLKEAPNANSPSFLLTFDKPLEPDKIYNLEYAPPGKQPLSFAFQTSPIFKVKNSTPNENSYGVPIDSGIEVTFTKELAGNFKDYFQIFPAVEGKFEQVGNTHIFIPNKLNYDTQYEVTISHNAKDSTGETLEKDYVFSFQTKWLYQDESLCSLKGDLHETFLPTDDIAFEMFMNQDLKDNNFFVEIYDLKTPENAINYQPLTNAVANLPKNAQLIDSIETKALVLENENPNQNLYYMMLEKTLPEGYYAVIAKTTHLEKEISLVKIVQVSALSVYSLSLNGETHFWINDTKTGKGAKNATIETEGTKAKTSDDGIALVKTVSSTNSTVKINYLDYPTYIYKNTTFAPAELNNYEKYYSYIYTDRSCYLSTDTIDVFGVVKPQKEQFGLTKNDKLTLSLGDILEIPLVLDEFGSFNTKIPIKNMNGYAILTLKLNDEYLKSTYIYFMNYEKSQYTTFLSTDKNAYFIDETAKVDIFVNTFDNVPVEGVEINSNNKNDTNTVTDKNGMATDKVAIDDENWQNDWRPFRQHLSYSVVGAQDNSQSIYGSVMVLPSDVMLEKKVLENNVVELTTNNIDYTVFNQLLENESYPSVDAYRGNPTDVVLQIAVMENVATRTKVGERYDFINKVNIPTYQYDYSEHVNTTFEAETENGKLLISNLPTKNNTDAYHYLVVSFKDHKGRNIKQTIYYEDVRNYFNSDNTTKEYNLYVKSREKPKETDRYNAFALNETRDVYVRYSGQPQDEQIETGNIFAIVARENAIFTTTGDPNSTPLTFTKDCIPNADVFAAYFDGKHVFPMYYPMNISYEYEEKNLHFDVVYDKEEYRPGDEVTATILVTDNQNKPQKALLNVSVVDEAVFHTSPHEAEFLENYYDSLYYYKTDFYVYSSYTKSDFMSFNANGGAEKGGEGDDYFIRKDFTDNPAFLSIQTDNKGIAKVTFKLSESITSWRVTTHAITNDMHVGSGKTNIVATMPFYVDMVMSNEFVVGDEVSFIAKSFGKAYTLNKTKVHYVIEVLQNGKTIATQTQESTNYGHFNVGSLPEGQYLVRLKATNGNLKDAIEEKFSVVKTGMLLPFVWKQTLSKENPNLANLSVLMSPVRVTLTNGDIAPITNILYSCISQNSNRTDYQAATAFANAFLSGLYTKTNASYVEEMENPPKGGSISELTYGTGDLFTQQDFLPHFLSLLTNKPLLTPPKAKQTCTKTADTATL